MFMGRIKLERKIHFKPKYKEFYTKNENSDTIHLLAEEMEALYLMDSKELYQADAANAMGVSRATFSKIIKNARQKVTMTLISGANLKIEDNKTDYLIMVPSDDETNITNSVVISKYFHIYHIKNQEIISKEVILNICNNTKYKPAKEIPKIALQHNINYLFSKEIGDGLKNALLSKGIYSIICKKEINIKNISQFRYD